MSCHLFDRLNKNPLSLANKHIMTSLQEFTQKINFEHNAGMIGYPESGQILIVPGFNPGVKAKIKTTGHITV